MLKETVTIKFILPSGDVMVVEGNIGESILQIAHTNNIPLESSCGGSLACATCHVIVQKNFFDSMVVSEEENDMLDLAFGLESTSRLACQIKVTAEMDGMEVKIPSGSNNFCGCCGECK